MNKKVGMTLAVLVGLVAAGLIIFALSTPATKTTPTNSTTQSESSNTTSNGAQTSGESATITYTDDGFEPSTITVKKGTTIKVINNSSHELQFSSNDHPSHLEDPEINMDILEPGKSGTFVARTVGTHGFHDHIDDSQMGTLIVTE